MGREAGQSDAAAGVGKKARQHDAAVAGAEGQAPLAEMTQAQTMAAAARREAPVAEAGAQALWPGHPGHDEVAAAVELPEASPAEAPLSGEPDKKRKRRRRRKKAAAAQPSGELKLAGSEGGDSGKAVDDDGKLAGNGGKAAGGKIVGEDSKASGDGREAAVVAADVAIAMRADAREGANAGVSASTDASPSAGEQPNAAESGEKPKRKRKKAKRKKAASAKAEVTAEPVDQPEEPHTEAAVVAEADPESAGLPVTGEQQEQLGKKRKRKRKKKPYTEQGVAGVNAEPSAARVVGEQGAVEVEAPSLPESPEDEGTASPARKKKRKKTKKAAKTQGLPAAEVAQVKEPVKSVTVAAVKAEKSVKTEKSKSAARANPMIPPLGYKPIWPDKGATSANLLSLRSILQEQDNVVRTVGQARIEDIPELVEEPRKSAELIKREADAFHHTPLRSNRPAKHSNALTRREMQAMREAKLTDHRSRFINHAELVERSKRQEAEGKPIAAGEAVKAVTGVEADVKAGKSARFEPFDYTVLRPTGKGIIRMRGRTDKGRRWYQEIEYDMAVTLVREQSAVVVNRQTINRLYSNRDFRSYILTRDNYTCYFCGQYGDTIDHLLPRAKGGHSTPLNCVCACNLCNQSKADKDLDVFLKHQKSGAKR